MRTPPVTEYAQVRLEELADTPFLMYQRSFVLNDRLMQACQQVGFTPKEIGRSGQADFLVALVVYFAIFIPTWDTMDLAQRRYDHWFWPRCCSRAMVLCWISPWKINRIRVDWPM